jgi:hypothetical protein
MVLPVLLMLIMGLGDIAFQAYLQSVLVGSVDKAGRDATIQGAGTQTADIDAEVTSEIQALSKSATVTVTRANYDNYAAIAGEPFTDSKYPNPTTGTFDGLCNHSESYIDVNSNSRYDLNLSAAGQGGANDVTKYTVTVTYKRMFPFGYWLGWGKTATIVATTILKNQPYATQTANTGTTSRTCP